MVQAFHVNVVSSLFRFADEFLITRFYSQGSHELLSLAGQASAYWKDGKFGSIMFLLWYASLSNIISTISSLSCKKVCTRIRLNQIHTCRAISKHQKVLQPRAYAPAEKYHTDKICQNRLWRID